MGGTTSIWGREQRQELTRWRKRTTYFSCRGVCGGPEACGAICSGVKARQVCFARAEGVGGGDTRIVVSSGQLFGPAHREGADTLAPVSASATLIVAGELWTLSTSSHQLGDAYLAHRPCPHSKRYFFTVAASASRSPPTHDSIRKPILHA